MNEQTNKELPAVAGLWPRPVVKTQETAPVLTATDVARTARRISRRLETQR